MKHKDIISLKSLFLKLLMHKMGASQSYDKYLKGLAENYFTCFLAHFWS
jgi:hypothetical protein